MARKTHEDALGVTGAETIIGTGVVVHGNLSSESDIIVDGAVTGSISTGGDVTLGVNAQVKGDLTGTNISVAGALTGNITAGGEATIRETGHVKGDIKSTGLAITSGAVFIGRSIMQAPPRLGDNEAPASPAED